MRKPLATTAAALSTALLTAGLLAAAPAADAASTRAASASYPVSSFNVTYGNTYTKGTITWYNRSIHVAGTQKSVSADSCRGTTAFGVDSKNHDVRRDFSLYSVCGTSAPFTIDVDFGVPGVSVARICLDNGAKTPPVVYLKCVRYGRPAA
ncbi:hypothetical protein ABZ901_01980 [Actinacidiphila alni]|uniref:hypothetical protein n=1 Tax=Actinacidiphila alni TaxID=380248 RepID=UPI0033F94F81